MSDRHVVPSEGGWHVERQRYQRLSARTATRAEAVSRAVGFVAREGGGRVIVYGPDGSVRDTRTVAGREQRDVAVREGAGGPAGGSPPNAGTSGGHALSTTGARPPWPAAARPSGGATVRGRGAAGRLSPRPARIVPAIPPARTPLDGAVVAEAARQATGDGPAEARDEATPPGKPADVALSPAVRRLDRATSAGEGAEEEPATVAARTERRIHGVVEQAALPLDHLTQRILVGVGRAAPAANPLRIAGYTIGAVAVTTVRVAEVVGAWGAAVSRGVRGVR